MKHIIKHYTIRFTPEEMNLIADALVKDCVDRPGFTALNAFTDQILCLRERGKERF